MSRNNTSSSSISSRGARSNGQQYQNQQSRSSDYERQQRSRKPPPEISRGYVVAVLENFGFIRSVDKLDDVFFHFSELVLGNSDDDGMPPIKIGDVVQFEVRTSRDLKEKAARVNILPPGTVLQWDEPFENEGIVRKGVIKKLPFNSSSSSTSNTSQDVLQSCGLIQPADDVANENIYFSFDDYVSSSNNSRGTNSRKDNPLGTKDLVEFRLVRNRRTKALFAREIVLIQSEKDRLAAEKEECLLKSSTSERGIVMALRRNGGYLRSTNHDVPIYFSYKDVITPLHLDEGGADYTFTEGCVVKFRVVYERADGSAVRPGENSASNFSFDGIRLSARQVEECASNETPLKFYDTLQKTVKGTIISLPSFSSNVSGQNLPLKDLDIRGSYGTPGRIRLHQHIEASCCNDNETTTEIIEVVEFFPEDAPGGYRIPNYMGNSKEQPLQQHDELWICPGDCVSFDVIRETFNYKSSLTASNITNSSYLNLQAGAWTRVRAHPPMLLEGPRPPTLRLEHINPAGRFEGIISTFKKEAGYGFIKMLDRNMDVYFRSSDLIPPDLLSKATNTEMLDLINVGSGVSFDLSVPSVQQEGNPRCKRILVLSVPDDSTSKTHLDLTASSWYFARAYYCLRKDVRAILSKRHANGSGMLEICYGDSTSEVEIAEENDPTPLPQSVEKIYGMSSNERYPNVAILLEALRAGRIPGHEIIFPWILPKIEAAVIINRAENFGAKVDFVNDEGNVLADGSVSALEWPGSGRIRIQYELTGDEKTTDVNQLEVDQCAELDARNMPQMVDGAELSHDQAAVKKPTKKGKESKPIVSIRFEKNALVSCDFLQEHDFVVCDVFQCRPTGKFEAFNVRFLKKGKIDNEAPHSTDCFGFIFEVVTARQFGFISMVDIDKKSNTAVIKEKVFFHVNDASKATRGGAKLRKGDEVKFTISNTKSKGISGGKKIAMNIDRLPQGTLPKLSISSCEADAIVQHDSKLCYGYVLLQPSNTKFSLSTAQKTNHLKSRGNQPGPTSSSGNRWQNVDLDRGLSADKSLQSSSNIENGRILLLKDPSGQLFSDKDTPKNILSLPEASDEKKMGATVFENYCHLVDKTASTDSDLIADVVASIQHVSYSKSAILNYSGSENHFARSTPEADVPRRGDFVVFGKSTKGTAKDVRVVHKNVAQSIRGHLTQINILEGTAIFVEEKISASESCAAKKTYNISLGEIISCLPTALQDLEKVEGIFHENSIYGICRTSDLYLASKVCPQSDKAERPKLNLTVKKELQGLGGKIIAQSGMAKGPESNSRGFAKEWTSRKSLFSS